MSDAINSRIRGFYQLPVRERIEALSRNASLDAETRRWFERGGGLDVRVADARGSRDDKEEDDADTVVEKALAGDEGFDLLGDLGALEHVEHSDRVGR